MVTLLNLHGYGDTWLSMNHSQSMTAATSISEMFLVLGIKSVGAYSWERNTRTCDCFLFCISNLYLFSFFFPLRPLLGFHEFMIFQQDNANTELGWLILQLYCLKTIPCFVPSQSIILLWLVLATSSSYLRIKVKLELLEGGWQKTIHFRSDFKW